MPDSNHSRFSGPALAIVGVLGFSFKAILVKLAYAWSSIDAVTLLTLRLAYAIPMFAAMAWWASRGAGLEPIARRDWWMLAWLGFIGYYLSSLLDFMGLEYISAALERLVLFLYPTMVVLLSAVIFRRRIDRHTAIALALSYGGIVLVFAHDLGFGTDPRALWIGGGLVFTSAFTYSLYLVGAGGVIARLGSMRFISWAMLISAGCVMAQFAATRPLAALAAPPRIQLLAMAMALVSTVLPTLLIAEAIRRIGADRTSLVGSMGPVFTIALGYWILAEPVYAVQLVGAALVLTGVTLVTLRRRSA